MRIIRIIKNYLLYCGIEKEDYTKVKKDAYVSNYMVWRVLHFLMAGVFGVLYVASFFSDLLKPNSLFYMIGFLYSITAVAMLFSLKKDSIVAQLLIYLSIIVLYFFGCFISAGRPESPAVTFIVLLLITPMFMIDKPIFMTIVLCIACVVFLIWMRAVKPFEVWQIDFGNVVPFTVIGIFLHVLANSVRIREFVLTKEINIQKDYDELTGLKNKSALTREINAFLEDPLTDQGALFILDIDRFKSINDTYGHSVGDRVIHEVGAFLGSRFKDPVITGRFGGDEFIVFLKNTGDRESVSRIASEIVAGTREAVILPDKENQVILSAGIALYHGEENNYSELFKKADTALYRAKADPEKCFDVFE